VSRKIPDPDSSVEPSTSVGRLIGQIRYDDREGPGWNPITTLPNGKVGISEFAIGCVGFAVLMALGWLVSHIRF
jgi:hypothetical protein